MRTILIISMAILLMLSAVSAYGQNSNIGTSSATLSNSVGEFPEDQAFTRFQRVTAGMKPPKPTYAPDPKFPDLPDGSEPRGTVVMLVGINPKGRVEAVRVLRSDEHAFEVSAVSTVKKWRFHPAEKDGHPVPVQVTVEMKFER